MVSEGLKDQRALEVRYRPIGNLTPDARNARTHPKRQIDQLKASIKEFGFTNPVLCDPEGGIIAGHGRLIAARALGMTDVPVIELSGLTDAQKRTLRLADNKIALNAGWDLEILQMELSELSAIDVDIDATLTGFTTGEIDVILDGPDDPDDEVIPAVPVTPRTRTGDIWVLGDHRIGCGDSRDDTFLHRVIGDDAHVDAAFLDGERRAPRHDLGEDRRQPIGLRARDGFVEGHETPDVPRDEADGNKFHRLFLCCRLSTGWQRL